MPDNVSATRFLDRSHRDRRLALGKVVIERSLRRAARLDQIVETGPGESIATEQRYRRIDDGLPMLRRRQNPCWQFTIMTTSVSGIATLTSLAKSGREHMLSRQAAMVTTEYCKRQRHCSPSASFCRLTKAHEAGSRMGRVDHRYQADTGASSPPLRYRFARLLCGLVRDYWRLHPAAAQRLIQLHPRR